MGSSWHHPEVFGRDSERARLLSAVYSASARTTPLICFLEGGPGAGKTTLLQEALRRAEEAGLGGSEVLALDDLHLRDPADLDDLSLRLSTHPSAPAGAPTSPPVSPLLPPPRLVLAASRPSSQPVVREIAAAAERTGTRIPLHGLPPDALHDLLRKAGHSLSEQQEQDLCAASGGNPGLALALAAGDPAPPEYPRSFAELDIHLRAFTEVLALAEEPKLPEVVADVATALVGATTPGAAEPPLLTGARQTDALRPLLRFRGGHILLRETPWRRIVRECLPEERRTLIHRMLAGHTTGLARARHLQAAADLAGDSALAAELEQDALRQLELGDYSQASDLMILAAKTSTGEEHLRLLIDACLILSLSERPSVVAAHEPMLTALEGAEVPAHLHGSEIVMRAGVMFFAGEYPGARRLLRHGLKAAGPLRVSPGVEWLALLLLAVVEAGTGDAEASLQAAEEARSLGVPVQTPVFRVMDRLLSVRRIHALWGAGRMTECAGALEEFLSAHPGTPEWVQCMDLRSLMRFTAGDAEGALADLEENENVAARLPIPDAFLQRILANRAIFSFQLGHRETAVTAAQELLAMAARTRDRRDVGIAHAVLALAAAEHGDTANQALHTQQLVRRTDPNSPLALYHMHSTLVMIAQLAADHEGALRAIAAFRRDGTAAWADTVGLHGWRALHIESLLALGQLDRAERELDRLSSLVASSPGMFLPHGHPLGLRAKLNAARGEGLLAEQQFDAAVALSAQFPYVRARALRDLGLHQRARGRHSEAERNLKAARDLFARLGAVPSLVSVESKLLSASDRQASLTDRERDIAYLVSQGLTNREIAQTLFVSVKTVEFHVSNLLPKLGITSRRQLWTAAAVASQRVSPPAPSLSRPRR